MKKSLKVSLACLCLICLLASIAVPAVATDPAPANNAAPIEATQQIDADKETTKTPNNAPDAKPIPETSPKVTPPQHK